MAFKLPWKPTLGQQLLRGGLQGLVVGGAFALGGLLIEGVSALVQQGLEGRQAKRQIAEQYAAMSQSQQTRPVA
jgi:hypothetical protein